MQRKRDIKWKKEKITPSFFLKDSEQMNIKQCIYLNCADAVHNTKQRARIRLGLTGSQISHTVQKTVTSNQ